MIAIAALTILSLSIFLAMIAVSRWLADRWERRRAQPELPPFSQAIIDEIKR